MEWVAVLFQVLVHINLRELQVRYLCAQLVKAAPTYWAAGGAATAQRGDVPARKWSIAAPKPIADICAALPAPRSPLHLPPKHSSPSAAQPCASLRALAAVEELVQRVGD